MNYGFYHPERGYWQTNNHVSDDIRATYPPGTIEVPVRPSQDYEWLNGKWAKTKNTDAAKKVNAERRRRLLRGTVIEVTGHGPVAVEGRDEDVRNLQTLAVIAEMKVTRGLHAEITQFRDRDNADHHLDQVQIVELWTKWVAFTEAVYRASWKIKDDPNGIPSQYASDVYWP